MGRRYLLDLIGQVDPGGPPIDEGSRMRLQPESIRWYSAAQR